MYLVCSIFAEKRFSTSMDFYWCLFLYKYEEHIAVYLINQRQLPAKNASQMWCNYSIQSNPSLFCVSIVINLCHIVSRQPQLFEFYPWCTNKEEMFVLRAYMHIFPSPIVGWTVLVFNMDISKTLSKLSHAGVVLNNSSHQIRDADIHALRSQR